MVENGLDDFTNRQPKTKKKQHSNLHTYICICIQSLWHPYRRLTTSLNKIQNDKKKLTTLIYIGGVCVYLIVYMYNFNTFTITTFVSVIWCWCRVGVAVATSYWLPRQDGLFAALFEYGCAFWGFHENPLILDPNKDQVNKKKKKTPIRAKKETIILRLK